MDSASGAGATASAASAGRARGPPPDRVLVRGQREDQHRALDDLLPEVRDAGEDDPGVDDSDRHHPEEDAEWMSAATGEGRASEDRGGQDVELELDADRRRRAAEASDRQD